MRGATTNEVREPGYGWEVSDDDTSPYYLPTSTLGADGELLEEEGHGDRGAEGFPELVIPRRFVVELARSTLDSLKRHYTDAMINPYEAYRFGSHWSVW